MPWTCPCSAASIEDDRACPACGSKKAAWTLFGEKTRRFVVAGKKVMCLRGADCTARAFDDPARADDAPVEAKAAVSLSKAEARRLAASGLLPPSQHMLLVRLAGASARDAVTLVAGHAHREAEEHRLAPMPESSAGGERGPAIGGGAGGGGSGAGGGGGGGGGGAATVDVPIVLVHGEGDLSGITFAGARVVDITDAGGDGHAPEITVAGTRGPALRLPVTKAAEPLAIRDAKGQAPPRVLLVGDELVLRLEVEGEAVAGATWSITSGKDDVRDGKGEPWKGTPTADALVIKGWKPSSAGERLVIEARAPGARTPAKHDLRVAQVRLLEPHARTTTDAVGLPPGLETELDVRVEPADLGALTVEVKPESVVVSAKKGDLTLLTPLAGGVEVEVTATIALPAAAGGGTLRRTWTLRDGGAAPAPQDADVFALVAPLAPASGKASKAGDKGDERPGPRRTREDLETTTEGAALSRLSRYRVLLEAYPRGPGHDPDVLVASLAEPKRPLGWIRRDGKSGRTGDRWRNINLREEGVPHLMRLRRAKADPEEQLAALFAQARRLEFATNPDYHEKCYRAFNANLRACPLGFGTIFDTYHDERFMEKRFTEADGKTPIHSLAALNFMLVAEQLKGGTGLDDLGLDGRLVEDPLEARALLRAAPPGAILITRGHEKDHPKHCPGRTGGNCPISVPYGDIAVVGGIVSKKRPARTAKGGAKMEAPEPEPDESLVAYNFGKMVMDLDDRHWTPDGKLYGLVRAVYIPRGAAWKPVPLTGG